MLKKLELISFGITITIIVLISILDLIGIFDNIPWLPKRIPTIILLVIAIIASYFVFKLSELTNEIRQGLRIIKDTSEVGIVEVYQSRSTIHSPKWSEFIGKAKKVIWLYGIAEGRYAEDKSTSEILEKLTNKKDNVDIRILLLDARSQVAKKLDKEEGGIGAGVIGIVTRALEQFKSIKNKDKNCKDKIKIRVYDFYPQVSIVRADDQILVTHYLRYLPGNSCVTYLIRNVPNGIFKYYRDHFEEMWENSSEFV